MNRQVKIFKTPEDLAVDFAAYLAESISISSKKKKPFTIAVSGGSTPELLFSLLGDNYAETIPWDYVHLFWGDERCVPPEDKESNYGMVRRKLLDSLRIPYSNVHRIKGENEPAEEAERYAEEILANTVHRDNLPVFDLVMLGVGDDGHTASIFPDNLGLIYSEKICQAVTHPVSGQKRITMTGRVINNADNIVFLVTGKNKAHIIQKILEKDPAAINLPAYNIKPVYGMLKWFIDNEAGSLLKEK
ncbi:MAG TPA: 6-phosphogluconolactonase [Bacteroidales bacterium]|nr:6-phosphogluconolactonase [Bacteroidales bacterium]